MDPTASVQVEDKYITLTLWEVLLAKFVEWKQTNGSFIFLPEFIQESCEDREDIAQDVEERLLTLGGLCFDILLSIQRSPDDIDAQFLDPMAERVGGLFLQCLSPGRVYDWITGTRSINSAGAELALSDRGISNSLVEAQIGVNKYRNENLRCAYSASSKLMVCNYSAHGGEIQAELRVRFPDCWPLRLGVVEVSPVVGLSKGKNARLKMSIQSVFRMNGVQNAIQIWIENIEGFLVNVEECYICYSVTYHHGTKGTGTGTGSGGSIPNKQCKTCKHKFHSECLLKYFRTSGKTICCLCQNPF